MTDAIPPILQEVFTAWAEHTPVTVKGIQPQTGLITGMFHRDDRAYVRLRLGNGADLDVLADGVLLDFGDGA